MPDSLKRHILPTIMRVCSSLVMLSVLEACDFFRTDDDVQLTLPSAGISFPGEDKPDIWNITWLASERTVSHQKVHRKNLPHIAVSREIPIIIIATPAVTKSIAPFRIKPAGCVLAAESSRKKEVSLNWKDGFVAELLLHCAEAGISPNLLNIQKFTETAYRRSRGNPWSLDRKKLSMELLSGTLREYSFRRLPSVNVSLLLPPGHWYSEFPLDPPMISETGIWKGTLSTGLHHFMRSIDGKVVTASIDESGEVIVLSEN